MERSLRQVAFAGAVLAILSWPARASAADASKDVRVINTAGEAVPVAVVNPTTAPAPFQKHVANLEQFEMVELASVPAGKRLVIEYINAFAGGSGDFDTLQINTSDDEGGVVLAFRFVSGFVDAHPRIIVGPGRTVSARNMNFSGDATLTVSGHYEPEPTVQ